MVARVVGSFTYNVTMILGAGARARPLRVAEAELSRGPWIAMLGSLVLELVIGRHNERINRSGGLILLGLYPMFVAAVVIGA